MVSRSPRSTGVGPERSASTVPFRSTALLNRPPAVCSMSGIFGTATPAAVMPPSRSASESATGPAVSRMRPSSRVGTAVVDVERLQQSRLVVGERGGVRRRVEAAAVDGERAWRGGQHVLGAGAVPVHREVGVHDHVPRGRGDRVLRRVAVCGVVRDAAHQVDQARRARQPAGRVDIDGGRRVRAVLLELVGPADGRGDEADLAGALGAGVDDGGQVCLGAALQRGPEALVDHRGLELDRRRCRGRRRR